jgi:hypothetical protein
MASGSRASLTLLALVGIALAVGAGAALLSGTTPSAAPHSGPGLTINLPDEVWGVLLLVLLLLGMGAIIARRLWGGAVLPTRVLAYVAVLLLLGLMVVLASHFATGGGCFCTPLTSSSNSSFNASNNTNSTNHTSNSTLFGIGPPLSVSSALPYLVVVAVGLGSAAIAIPLLLARVIARRDAVKPPPATEDDALRTRDALAAAASELDEGLDPRTVIVRLYDRLLARVAPLVGGVAYATAEEIRTVHLLTLGVRSSAAEALTRLFEEARYSSHPLSPAAVARARDAIRAAEDDLARVGTRP